MDNGFIQSKLRPPGINADLVERRRLIQLLNQNPNRKLTLVSAPAGYGKSTLITTWLNDQPHPYAWLSLDEFDNDPVRFLHYVAKTVQVVFPEACAGLLQILQEPDLPAPSILAEVVINDVSQLPRSILLVLDDYHLLHNAAILRLVARVLAQADDKLHLVLISRGDPLLPLPRLRLQQALVEIRQHDLRFADAEALAFLQMVLNREFDSGQVAVINQQMEGWVAGLRLATLSLQHSEQAELTLPDLEGNPQNVIAGYLFAEVLGKQTTAVQEFLLQTAWVDRFCVGLGAKLVQFSAADADIQEIIAYLQRAGLFIVPLPAQAGWYRYHHLFQQILRQKASLMWDKAAIRALHNRAGNWFAGEGLVDEALQQFLLAEDMASAVALIEINSRNLLNNLERRRLEHWLELLPEGIVWQRPYLLTAKAWLFYRHWRIRELASVLQQLQQCLAENGSQMSPIERQFISGQLHTLQSATRYFLDGEYVESAAAAEQALNSLPATERGALATALGCWALSMQALGDSKTAVSRLQQALADPAPFGPAPVQLYLALSRLYLNNGELLSLKQVAGQFSAHVQGLRPGMAAAGWINGICCYELNQLDRARHYFESAVSLHYVTNFLAACDSWLALARICQIEDDLAQAQTLLDEVRAETIQLKNQTLLAAIEAFQAYQWLLQGDTVGALHWARAFDPDKSLDAVALLFAPVFFWTRILTTCGDPSEVQAAGECLQANIAAAQARQDVRHEIQSWIHLALVQTTLGSDNLAQASLGNALRLAKPGGFVRVFADCAPAIRPLLEKLDREGTSQYVDQLLSIGVHHSPQEPGELHLTNRETEILQLMQTGLSNKEIAQQLVISLYTVKRHASNIYRKLDVDGRRQAIYKSQQIGILAAQ